MNIRKSFLADQRRALDISSVAAGTSMVTGRAAVNGSGEALVDVQFPARFTTLPYFSFGFELQDTSEANPEAPITSVNAASKGLLPTGSAHIATWKTIERLPFGVYYVGATVGVIVDGASNGKIIINYSFSGTALSNPSL